MKVHLIIPAIIATLFLTACNTKQSRINKQKQHIVEELQTIDTITLYEANIDNIISSIEGLKKQIDSLNTIATNDKEIEFDGKGVSEAINKRIVRLFLMKDEFRIRNEIGSLDEPGEDDLLGRKYYLYQLQNIQTSLSDYLKECTKNGIESPKEFKIAKTSIDLKVAGLEMQLDAQEKIQENSDCIRNTENLNDLFSRYKPYYSTNPSITCDQSSIYLSNDDITIYYDDINAITIIKEVISTPKVLFEISISANKYRILRTDTENMDDVIQMATLIKDIVYCKAKKTLSIQQKIRTIQ